MVVQKEDSAIQQINNYSLNSAISFPNTYPLDIDLSGGYRYLMFEQPGPGVLHPSIGVFHVNCQNKNNNNNNNNNNNINNIIIILITIINI